MKFTIISLLSTLQVCLLVRKYECAAIVESETPKVKVDENILNKVKNEASVINSSVVNAFEEIEKNADTMLKNAEESLKKWQSNPSLKEHEEKVRSTIKAAHDRLIKMCETVRNDLTDAASDMNYVQDVEQYKNKLMQLEKDIENYIQPAAEELQLETSFISEATRTLPEIPLMD